MGSYYDFESLTDNGWVPFRAVVKEELIAFFDRRYDFTPNGQFTGASYYLDDFLSVESGLQLYGGESSWYLSPKAVRSVKEWVRS